jgi:GcrA cell cycle regulator
VLAFLTVKRNAVAWNDERIAMLKKLWSEGLSATQIAERLGGCTRNAVIGKVTRMKLVRHTHKSLKAHRGVVRLKRKPMAAPGTDARLVRTSEGPAPWRIKAAAKEPVPLPAEDDVPTKTLMDLEPGDCRWRVDKPLGSDPYGFCAKEALPGLTFCEGHARRAYANWAEVQHKYVEVKEKAKEAEPA